MSPYYYLGSVKKSKFIGFVKNDVVIQSLSNKNGFDSYILLIQLKIYFQVRKIHLYNDKFFLILIK